MTGMDTAAMIPSIMSGSLIRDTPPWARMSAGTRSRAMTATAPASSAIFAWSAVTTSMMTPPFSISAMPRLTRLVPVTVPDWVSHVCLAHPSIVVSPRRAERHGMRGPPSGGGVVATGAQPRRPAGSSSSNSMVDGSSA